MGVRLKPGSFSGLRGMLVVPSFLTARTWGKPLWAAPALFSQWG